jgi:hypothetical protein
VPADGGTHGVLVGRIEDHELLAVLQCLAIDAIGELGVLLLAVRPGVLSDDDDAQLLVTADGGALLIVRLYADRLTA